jgi:hypothetical protein
MTAYASGRKSHKGVLDTFAWSVSPFSSSSKQAVRLLAASTASKPSFLSSPSIIRNPGFSCTVTVAKPHVSTIIWRNDGELAVDTHTYVGCTSVAWIEPVTTLWVLQVGGNGYSGVWNPQPDGVGPNTYTSNVESPQSNFYCAPPADTLDYYGSSGYAVINGTVQDSSNLYDNVYVPCVPPYTPALVRAPGLDG